MIERFLSGADVERALRAFHKIAQHDISRWALTGGLAIEIHCQRLEHQPSIRTLIDLDFVAEGFDCIPESLADGFLFRHIHPLEPTGKTMLQFVHPDSTLRIDVFRASGATMSRAERILLPSGPIQIVSLEDLVARAARLVLDLVNAVPVPSKHARDYLRLADLVEPGRVEAPWQDHRRPEHPTTFAETSCLLQKLIPARVELLITPVYSRDIREFCPRCMSTVAFQLADPHAILSVLGYC